MSDSFMVTPAEVVLPSLTPREVAHALSTALGAPPMIKRLSGDSLVVYYAGQIEFEDQPGVIRASAEAVRDALIQGTWLRSYIQVPASGAFFRIPTGYWVMKSGVENPWSVLETLDRFPHAAGFDDSMVGEPIHIPEKRSSSFIAQVMASLRGTKPEGVEAPPVEPRVRPNGDDLVKWASEWVDAGRPIRQITAKEIATRWPGRKRPTIKEAREAVTVESHKRGIEVRPGRPGPKC